MVISGLSFFLSSPLSSCQPHVPTLCFPICPAQRKRNNLRRLASFFVLLTLSRKVFLASLLFFFCGGKRGERGGGDGKIRGGSRKSAFMLYLSRMYDEQDRTAFPRPTRILADQATAWGRKKLSFYWISNSMQLFFFICDSGFSRGSLLRILSPR